MCSLLGVWSPGSFSLSLSRSFAWRWLILPGVRRPGSSPHTTAATDRQAEKEPEKKQRVGESERGWARWERKDKMGKEKREKRERSDTKPSCALIYYSIQTDCPLVEHLVGAVFCFIIHSHNLYNSLIFF